MLLPPSLCHSFIILTPAWRIRRVTYPRSDRRGLYDEWLRVGFKKKIQTTNVKDEDVIQKIISGTDGTVKICKNREVKEVTSSSRLTCKGVTLLLRPLRLLGLFRPTRVLVSLRTLLTSGGFNRAADKQLLHKKLRLGIEVSKHYIFYYTWPVFS